MTYPFYNQWSPQYQATQFDPNTYFQNPLLAYPMVNQQNISPIFEMMARQQFLNFTEAQRRQQLGYPYQQSFTNTYF
jgi:hypothetical protein